MKTNFDVIIVGGGLIGLSVAYGLARRGHDCLLLDSSDTDFKAARGNFGLVWVQGKGAGFPAYADWTMRSSELWPELRDELQEHNDRSLALEQDGGIHICLSERNLQIVKLNLKFSIHIKMVNSNMKCLIEKPYLIFSQVLGQMCWRLLVPTRWPCKPALSFEKSSQLFFKTQRSIAS